LFRKVKPSGKKLKKRGFWEDGEVGNTTNLSTSRQLNQQNLSDLMILELWSLLQGLKLPEEVMGCKFWLISALSSAMATHLPLPRHI